MKKSKFSEEQIVQILKEQEGGRPVTEITRAYGISAQTFYRWRDKFAGMDCSEVQRLKSLEDENTRLRRLVADLSLDKAVLKDIIEKKL